MKKLILIAGMCSAMHLDAQNTGNANNWYGQLNIHTLTTAQFLRIFPDARAGGMGDGSIALCNDANAMHWNVSKLALVPEKYGVSASYVPWMRTLYPDINMLYVAGYAKLDSVSAIGASFRHFSMGTITITNSSGQVLGEHIPKEMAVDVGYSRKLNDHFSAGLTFRYISANPRFDTSLTFMNRQSAFSGDLGLTWRSDVFRRGDHSSFQFTSGFALTNVGSKMRVEESGRSLYLPVNLGLAQGVEWNFGTRHDIAFQAEINKLLVPTPPVYALDTNGAPQVVNGQYVIVSGKDPDRPALQGMLGSFNDAPGGAKEEFREIMWSTGLEYAYRRMFKLRAGYFHEHKTKGNRQFATVGAGIAYKGLALDFCYLFPVSGQRSALEHAFRFTVLLNINQFKFPSRNG